MKARIKLRIVSGSQQGSSPNTGRRRSRSGLADLLDKAPNTM